MKILYLTYGTQSGVVSQISNYFRISGHDIKVIDVAGPLYYRHKDIKLPRLKIDVMINVLDAVKSFGKHWKRRYYRTEYAFSLMSKYGEDIIKKNLKSDVILQSGVLFRVNARLYNVRYILGILDNTYLIGREGIRRPITSLVLTDKIISEERKTYEEADLIFVMSLHVKHSLMRDYGVEENKIVVTGVGPNVEPRKDQAIPENKYHSKKIVMIGIDFERKGGYVLLEAFKKLRLRIPECQLKVIGPNKTKEIEGVEFTGILNKEQVAEELLTANLFVLPSFREPFGVAYIEAMAFHTPCIGTDVEAVPEIIDDGVTGYVVAPGNVDFLEDRIIRILQDPGKARSMGYAGRKKFEERYRWTVVGTCMESHMSSLLLNSRNT